MTQPAWESSLMHQRRQLGNTGISVSPLGFGASPLGNVFGEINVSRWSSYLFLTTFCRSAFYLAGLMSSFVSLTRIHRWLLYFLF